MLDRREFRELLVADVALVRGVAEARDVAAALMRFWDKRGEQEISIGGELERIAGILPERISEVEIEVDQLIRDAGGNPRSVLTEMGGLDASIHQALWEQGARMSRALTEVGAHVRLDLPVISEGRYVDFVVAGSGGMGVVYQAFDTRVHRSVALKIVRTTWGVKDAPANPFHTEPPECAAEDHDRYADCRVRLQQEAWVTGGLEHPGVLPLFDLGQTSKGIPFYTMRFVRSLQTLKSALEDAEDARLEERLQLVEPFLKVCDTVAHAHSRGVIHRDLKPENVMLGEYGDVVVLDWGLAKFEGREDLAASRWQEELHTFRKDAELRTAGAAGTPGYMSPEAGRGLIDRVDAKSDVFSLGVILFEILTGRPPFTFRSWSEFLDCLDREDAPSPQEVDPEVPSALSALVRHCLEPARPNRMGSVEELARSLRAWQTASAVERETEALLGTAKEAVERAEAAGIDQRVGLTDRAAAAVELAAARAPETVEVEELRTRAAQLRSRCRDEDAHATISLLRIFERLTHLLNQAETLDLHELDVRGRASTWLRQAHGLRWQGPKLLDALEKLRTHEQASAWLSSLEPPEAAWQDLRVSDLVALAEESLQGDGRIHRRIRRLRDQGQCIERARRNAGWSEARERVAKSPLYGGLELDVEFGFVPLGPDPVSGLEEFACCASGSTPKRDAASGRLALGAQSAIVMVLLPGGTFWMGAQPEDESGRNWDALARPDEAPVHEVTVAPFFLAKHPCTYAQWRATTGDETEAASLGSADSLRSPVVGVSWFECRDALAEHVLHFPSEAQWEYACRGGTSTPYWSGRCAAALTGIGWVDVNAAEGRQPVGMKPGNPFGLHDMHGNVWEWCADRFRPYRGAELAVKRRGALGGSHCVCRGGSWYDVGRRARSSSRNGVLPDEAWNMVGIRPFRELSGTAPDAHPAFRHASRLIPADRI